MILGTAEAQCVLKILQILDHGKSKYSTFFKESKASHSTLQKVLKELVKKKFIKKDDIGHMRVDYSITGKGNKLLGILEDLDLLL